MLYICCRETDGYQQVSNECAPAATVHSWAGCRRNQARHSERTALARTDIEAGRASQAVWTKSGAGTRSTAAARGGGVGCLVSSPRYSGCVVIARGHCGSFLYKNHAGNNRPAIGSSKNDRVRFSEGRNHPGSNGQESESRIFRGTELGLPRSLVCARRHAATVEYREDPSSSRPPLSLGRVRGRGFQEGITGWPSPDPRCVPQARRRSSGSGTAHALVRIRQEHRSVCPRGDGRFCVCRSSPVVPNPSVSASHFGRRYLLLTVCSGLVAAGSDSAVTSLPDEWLTPGKSRSQDLFESLGSFPLLQGSSSNSAKLQIGVEPHLGDSKFPTPRCKYRLLTDFGKGQE